MRRSTKQIEINLRYHAKRRKAELMHLALASDLIPPLRLLRFILWLVWIIFHGNNYTPKRQLTCNRKKGKNFLIRYNKIQLAEKFYFFFRKKKFLFSKCESSWGSFFTNQNFREIFYFSGWKKVLGRRSENWKKEKFFRGRKNFSSPGDWSLLLRFVKFFWKLLKSFPTF